MVRVKGKLLPCLAVVLVLLSVTGVSSSKRSRCSSLLSEENTGRETEPAHPVYRQPTVPFIHSPGIPFRRNSPSISRRKVLNRNKPTVSTRNKLNRFKLNSPCNKKPTVSKAPIRKQSKCAISNKQKVPVNKNTKCARNKRLTVTSNKKSIISLYPVRKASKCPVSNERVRTIGSKPRCGLRTNPKVSVREKTKCPISHVPNALQVPARIKTKRPFRHNPKVPVSINKLRGNKPKMPKTNDLRIKIKFRLRYLISIGHRLCLHTASLFQSRYPSFFKPHHPLPPPLSLSSKFESVICEGRLGQFECPTGQRIQIESAVYGRQNRHVCWNYNMYRTHQNTNCRHDVTAILRKMCDHKILCYIYVDNKGMGGDPCPRTYKYMQFTASCV